MASGFSRRLQQPPISAQNPAHNKTTNKPTPQRAPRHPSTPGAWRGGRMDGRGVPALLVVAFGKKTRVFFKEAIGHAFFNR